jgi:hypothetical protein
MRGAGPCSLWGQARSLTMVVLKSFMIGSVVLYAALLVYVSAVLGG